MIQIIMAKMSCGFFLHAIIQTLASLLFFFFFPSCSECRFFFLILTQRDKNSKRESDRRGRGGEGRQGETETGSGESAIERRK